MQALDIPQGSRSFDNILNLKYDNVLVNGIDVPKPVITGLAMLHTD
jgi:hypothetical protein